MPEIGKAREFGQLLKTGQITQYGGYPDDGYKKKGLSRLYTIHTAGRHAGTTDITLNGKTDVHSNNCVYDRRTKLTWSRYVAGSIGPGSNGKLPWTTNVNGEGIFAFVAAANAAGLGGYTDWRIPNAFELPSLMDLEEPTAVPDSTAFPSWSAADYFWSSTTCPSYTANAMVVYFYNATVYNFDKVEVAFVSLVRGG